VTPPGFPEVYDVGVVALTADLHILVRFDETAPDHGEPVTLTLGPIRMDTDRSVLGPVFTAGGLPPKAGRVPEDPTGAPEPARGGRLGVSLAGVATTDFGRAELPAEQLAAKAALAAVADAGLAASDIDAVVVGSAFSTAALGQRMLRHVPWGGRRLLNVENACASGTTALAEAAALVRAGLADAVVAVGADTPVRSGGGLIPLDLSGPVAGVGVTLPALYALVADAYQARHGTAVDAFAEVVVRSRAAARTNPHAYRRDAVTQADVLASRPIADPITLFQCTPNADGASAVVVAADHLRSRNPHPQVELTSLVLRSGMARDRFSGDGIVQRAAREAYRRAGVDRADIGVVELHDAFAPAALTYLESLGLAEPGTAANRLLAGAFRGGSEVALNVGGGLLSRGHPPGATGLAQITELVQQLRGEAGERQVPDPGVGLVHTMGGTILELEANACTVGVLQRVP
jgi:acetyl-CoA acetyltransferase